MQFESIESRSFQACQIISDFFSQTLSHPWSWEVLYRVARKNATTLILNFMNIVNETELFLILFGRTFIFQQNYTMIMTLGLGKVSGL